MLRNYLTVAIRNLLRSKLYTFINVFGLGLGIACCLLIALFVRHEWSFDRFHQKADRIFHVLVQHRAPSGEVTVSPLLPLSVVEALSGDIPGIELVSGFIRSETRISNGSQTFSEHFAEVNADFLRIFTFPLLVGDPRTALTQPDAVVISEPMARKYFGELGPDLANALGQTLAFEGLKKEESLHHNGCDAGCASDLQSGIRFPDPDLTL